MTSIRKLGAKGKPVIYIIYYLFTHLIYLLAVFFRTQVYSIPRSFDLENLSCTSTCLTSLSSSSFEAKMPSIHQASLLPSNVLERHLVGLFTATNSPDAPHQCVACLHARVNEILRWLVQRLKVHHYGDSFKIAHILLLSSLAKNHHSSHHRFRHHLMLFLRLFLPKMLSNWTIRGWGR